MRRHAGTNTWFDSLSRKSHDPTPPPVGWTQDDAGGRCAGERAAGMGGLSTQLDQRAASRGSGCGVGLWSDPNAAPNDPFPPAPLPLSLFGERGAIALSFRKLPGESQSQLRDRLNWYRQLFPEADVDYAEIVPFKVIN